MGSPQGNARIVTAAIGIVTSVLQGIASNVTQLVTAGTNIIVNFINGISNSLSRVITAGVNLIVRFLEGIRQGANRITQAAFDLVIGMMDDFANAIDENMDEVIAAAGRIGDAIISAVGDAVRAGIGSIGDIISDAVGGFVDGALGFIPGVGESATLPAVDTAAITAVGDDIDAITIQAIESFKSMADQVDEIFAGMSTDPKITPVLDLSNVESSAKGLGAIFGQQMAHLSLSQARSAAQEAATAQEQSTSDETPAIRDVIFEQTINAPEQLSEGEIYRNTKSQITLAKAELEVV
jgi:hypothetical protein